MASAPNEVWTWDITRLPGPGKWVIYPLYVVSDLFSRFVVAWMVATRESTTLAKRLITNASTKQGIQPEQMTLHQDRGAPMKAKTFSQLMIDLDILASYSRPRVSDDNTDSESQFKTLKYAPAYPGRFTNVQEARTYIPGFFPWYNTQHRHSGLGLLTPNSVHYWLTQQLQATRQHVLDQAFLNHPERFVNGKPKPPHVPTKSELTNPKTQWNVTTCFTKLPQELSHSY